MEWIRQKGTTMDEIFVIVAIVTLIAVGLAMKVLELTFFLPEGDSDDDVVYEIDGVEYFIG